METKSRKPLVMLQLLEINAMWLTLPVAVILDAGNQWLMVNFESGSYSWSGKGEGITCCGNSSKAHDDLMTCSPDLLPSTVIRVSGQMARPVVGAGGHRNLHVPLLCHSACHIDHPVWPVQRPDEATTHVWVTVSYTDLYVHVCVQWRKYYKATSSVYICFHILLIFEADISLHY